VGNIMREAKVPGLPYHRVVAAGGALGGYGGNLGLKRALLIAEGLTVTGRRVRHFDQVSWP
jgi:O6-methylguanine-DNA--protein-cysteine methyltransferase